MRNASLKCLWFAKRNRHSFWKYNTIKLLKSYLMNIFSFLTIVYRILVERKHFVYMCGEASHPNHRRQGPEWETGGMETGINYVLQRLASAGLPLPITSHFLQLHQALIHSNKNPWEHRLIIRGHRCDHMTFPRPHFLTLFYRENLGNMDL